MLQKAVQTLKNTLGIQTEQKALSLSDPEIGELFGILPTSSGVVVNAKTAMSVTPVRLAIGLITENVGNMPVKVYRRTKNGKEVADDHPLYRLIHDRASPHKSAAELRVLLTLDALQTGHGFAHVVRVDGEPKEMHRLKPGSVQIKENDFGEPVYTVSLSNRSQMHLGYDEVLHISTFDGVSPISAGREAIALAAVLERHGNQFFGSGARPSAILTNEAPQGSETGKKVVENIKNSYRIWQSEANGDPLVLDAGWKYTQPVMTSTDAQFLEHRAFQVAEIARLFGVPPHLLFELSRATWGNASEMSQAFLQFALKPWLNRWQDAYTTALFGDDEDHFPEFVTEDLVSVDIAARTENITKLVAGKIMSVNEARSVVNLPRRPDGDTLENPWTSTTATTPAALPAPAPNKDSNDE